jgi:hypothetical protein
MNKLLLTGAFVALGAALPAVFFLALSDRTSHENMVLERGRIGTQAPLSRGPLTWTGRLVDAGCPNRGGFFLGMSSGQAAAVQPDAPAAEPTSASGISVSPETAQAERGDALAHQVPDLRTRQEDYACAITGMTRAFALVLPDGQLKNLDEGGNTMALEAFEHSSQGQAVLSGFMQGSKPRASVTGAARGDHIIAENIRLL